MTYQEWLDCTEEADSIVKEIEQTITGKDSVSVMLAGLRLAANAAAVLNRDDENNAAATMRLADSVFQSYYVECCINLNLQPPAGTQQ